ncbi:MAG: phytanoyl-CoA dioxygenase family protein [Chloroflexi bacterium]|nr:phytanoyl-CoA dioxygenase family protein [Chloroflexota bacterium]
MPALTAEQLEHFRTDGYVVVEDVVSPNEVLEPLEVEYAMVLDKLAEELFEGGKISSTYAGLPFGERLTRVYQDSGKVHSGYFDFSLPQNGISHDTPMWHGPAVFDTLTAPSLLDAVESIIGPEIYSNPVQHVRMKPPEHLTPKDESGRVQLGATPWHQDLGVVTEAADDTDMLTVWIPVWDANEEAGCLQLVPWSHDEGLAFHCAGPNAATPGLHIPDDQFRIEDAVAIPMKRGSALFMHRLTCHGSLPNKSDRIRWSLDLRYNPIGQPTGRDVFPGFVARSKAHPETELRDPEAWAQSWIDARELLAQRDNPVFKRWDTDDPSCA